MKNPLLNYVINDKNISNLFIILNLSPEPIDTRIYSLEIEESIFYELMGNYILVETTKNILKKIILSTSIVSMHKDTLEKINLLRYPLEETNNVIFYPYFLYNQFKIYLSIYEKKTITDLYNILLINKHIQDKKDTSIQQQYYQFIISMCKSFDKIERLTKNREFVNRQFFQANKYHNNGYLSFMGNKNKSVLDIHNNFKELKQQLNFILHRLNYDNKILIIGYLLISKDYCHLIINNINLLKKYKCIFNQYTYLFRYLLGFTWSQLYIKEMNKKKDMTRDDIFIFDINTANNLINFPNSTSCINFNPYNCIMINNKFLNSNIYSLNYYSISNNIFSAFEMTPIGNINQFKVNFNIFTTSNPNTNLFQDINFKKNNIAITGSAVCACIAHFHPLMCLFNNYNDETSIKNRYYNEYYANADIDVMIKTKDFKEFINTVKKVYEQIKKNIINIYKPEASSENIKLICEKVVYHFLYEEEMVEILNNYNSKNNTIYDFKDVLQNIDSEYVQNIFKDSYEKALIQYKKEKEDEIIDEEFIKNNPEYLELDNIPFKIRKVQKFKDITMDKIKISFKYKIKSQFLNHNIELFNVTTIDFFGVVQTFHLPCVRAYFDDNNVYMTPSCISAHLTRMNLDYKYFAGTSHPCEIINKYRMRGFGIYLNTEEQDVLFNYSKNNTFWNNLYNLNSSNKNRFMNALNFNDKLFFPRLYNSEYFDECFPVDLDKGYDKNFIEYKKIIVNKNDLLENLKTSKRFNENYKFKDIIDFINKITIFDSSGVVISCKEKEWIIDSFIIHF